MPRISKRKSLETQIKATTEQIEAFEMKINELKSQLANLEDQKRFEELNCISAIMDDEGLSYDDLVEIIQSQKIKTA